MRSYGQYCSVAKALDVVGDRWNLLIVRELLLRAPLRYTDLRRGLPGIATNLLSDRLRALEAGGVVTREEAPPPIATTVFELTERGRQLDSVLSTTRALPDVVDAVGDRVEVLVDGGVRTGLDVVKLVAMGARAVLIGRAWAWAVAARGEPGVRHVLQVMKADIDTALGLTGQTSVADLDRSALYRTGAPVT